MFKPISIAEFESDGHKAQFIIDNSMPVATVQDILNQLMHFCVERIKDAENIEAQRLQDEEASKEPELDDEVEEEVVVETAQEESKE